MDDRIFKLVWKWYTGIFSLVATEIFSSYWGAHILPKFTTTKPDWDTYILNAGYMYNVSKLVSSTIVKQITPEEKHNFLLVCQLPFPCRPPADVELSRGRVPEKTGLIGRLLKWTSPVATSAYGCMTFTTLAPSTVTFHCPFFGFITVTMHKRQHTKQLGAVEPTRWT